MMEYAQVVFDAESTKKLALESLIKGETPSAALLRQLRRPTNDGIGKKINCKQPT